MQIRDILRLQNEHGLVNDVVDVRRHFARGVAGGDLFDPPGIDVNRVKRRPSRSETKREK